MGEGEERGSGRGRGEREREREKEEKGRGREEGGKEEMEGEEGTFSHNILHATMQ